MSKYLLNFQNYFYNLAQYSGVISLIFRNRLIFKSTLPLLKNHGADVTQVKVKVAQLCPTLCDSMVYTWTPWNSPGRNTGVGSLSLLQGIFPTQGSNPGLPHCRWILYHLSHKGSPRILEWAIYPFSSRSTQPKNETRVPALQADSLPMSYQGSPV